MLTHEQFEALQRVDTDFDDSYTDYAHYLRVTSALNAPRIYDPMREPRSTREMMTPQQEQAMKDAGKW